jgi:hypothetical protein
MQGISLIHSDFVAEAIGKARILYGLFFEIPEQSQQGIFVAEQGN